MAGSSLNSAIIAILLFTAALLMMSHLAVTPVLADYYITSGNYLSPGKSITNGGYSLIMKYDCNLVLYDAGSQIWASGTADMGVNCILQLQLDGNLVIYRDFGAEAVWASNTDRSNPVFYYSLVLQADRNVVIYDGDHHAIWATNTQLVE